MELLTINEVAGILRVDRHRVYELIKQGHLNFIRVGTKPRSPKRIKREDLDLFLEGNYAKETI